jgi:ATP phosphoribosyltransferase regulatory subunit
VQVGAEALAAVGLTRLSFDLTLPPLVPALLDEADVPEAARRALTHALDRKDAVAVARHGGVLARTLTDLLLAAGAADAALAALDAAALPNGPRAIAGRLAATIAAIRHRAPALKLTVDPVEFRGFRYHTGVCMTIYAPGRHEELGRGGRYTCGGPPGESEPATGLTLYPDAVLRAAPPRNARPRVYLAQATLAEAAKLRREGYATVAALTAAPDAAAEARRLGCTHIFSSGGISVIDPDK